MIVVDASVVVDLLLRTGAPEKVEDRILGPPQPLHAPQLLDVEVIQVLRRHARKSDLDHRRMSEVLEDLRALPLTRHPHEPFLERIWSLRTNLTAYDAAYVALAEALEAPLVTRDARLAAAPGHTATVEVL